MIAKVQELAARLRKGGLKAQVKNRKSGIYLSVQGHADDRLFVKARINDRFPASRMTSGGYSPRGFDTTWRIL